ncbi:MAG: helix-turn-helix transcriptional regulator [Chloroflexota bacterium]
MGRLQKAEIDKIAKYRKEGYTQAETAEKVGVHIKSVQKYDPLRQPAGGEAIGLPQPMTTRDMVALLKTQGDLIDAALLTLRFETNARRIVCPKCLEGKLDEENGVYTCLDCGYAMKLFANVWLDQ